MTEFNGEDIKKLDEAIQCIRKTLKCTLCQKLPTEPRAAKCGHPFCKTCVEKILHTKKAVCSICKTVLIHSSIREAESINKIIKDLNFLCKAVQNDSKTTISLDKPQNIKKYPGKRTNLTLPGPEVDKIVSENSSTSNLSTEIPDKRRDGRRSRTKKIAKAKSDVSEKTIKLPKVAAKSPQVPFAEPSTSRALNLIPEPVFTADNLENKIGAIGYKEKVEDWLNSEEFEDEIPQWEKEFPEIEENPGSNSPPTSEVLESYSQLRPNSSESLKSGRNSRAAKTPKQNEHESLTTAGDGMKFKSFTFDATSQRKQSFSKSSTPAEKMFDDLCRKTMEEQQLENKISKVQSLSNNSSWSELARLKKESKPKVRRRKKLNISIERPRSAKPLVESLEQEDSEEQQETENINSTTHEKSKESELNTETNDIQEPTKNRTKPSLRSSRMLEQSEMIDFGKLNRRQVREIIGGPSSEVDLNASRNSTISPVLRNSNKRKESLERSGERCRDITNEEEEETVPFEKYFRPQSKQSIHTDENRPDSRLSCKSTDKPMSQKFRLSTGRKSSTPNETPSKIAVDSNTDQPGNEDGEKIHLKKDSPVRVCDESIRNKLSLKRSSPGSSRMTEHESKASPTLSIEKLEEFYKSLKELVVKTQDAETQTIEINKEEPLIVIRSVGIQTSPTLARTDSTLDDIAKKSFSTHSMPCTIIPETRAASTASSGSKRTHEARAVSNSSKTMTPCELQEDFDTAIKVQMMSAEKDSQLKYFAKKSPAVSRTNRLHSENSDKNTKPRTVLGETGFANSEEYSKAVKRCALELIGTDSEDQDTPNEDNAEVKRKINHKAMKNRSPTKAVSSATTSNFSKTTSSLSDIRMNEKVEVVSNRIVSKFDESRSVKSNGNDSGGKLSYISPKRKKYSKDSLGSETRSSTGQKIESLLNKTGESSCKNSSASEAATVLPYEAKKKDDSQNITESDVSGSARNKVVRKLKYSQESGNSGSLEKQTANHKEQKNDRLAEKKAFQRIRRPSSTDSENEFLEISLTNKESSTNSPTLPRPGPSQIQRGNRSPILSEELTVEFSSNKDTQESKRKRSPSPNSLDNHDLQAIASNWCADLDHCSEEIAPAIPQISERNKNISGNEIPPKKPRIEVQASPASTSSLNYPALSPTAIHGNGRRSKDPIEMSNKINSQFGSLNNEESLLNHNLDEVARQFDGIDAKVELEKSQTLAKNCGSISTNKTRHINPVVNEEYSIQRCNTFSGIVTTKKHSAPIRAKSLLDRNSPELQCSLSSDKENCSLENWSSRTRDNKEQENDLNHDLRRLRRTENENISKSNEINIPIETDGGNNIELLESSFDPDCMNITQEQILLKELENNLLGRKSNDVTKKTSEKPQQEIGIIEKTPKKIEKQIVKEPAVNNVDKKNRGFEIAQIESDDFGPMDEDIIDCTPEKDLASKKDFSGIGNYSQRSNATLKSFMSVNMTPIPKANQRDLQIVSDITSLPESVAGANGTNHSTPKPITIIRKRDSLQKSPTLEVKRNEENSRLCLVCSSLDLKQVENVKAFARKHNIEYTASYKPEVTHVIVKTEEGDLAGRTLKFLLGIAHKKWIVSYRWVTDSIRQNKIVGEEDYEVLDSESEERGPRKSRLSTKGLFNDFAFLCMKPFSEISIEQLQDMIASTGGTVVQTLDEIASVSDKYRLILYRSETYAREVLDKWRQKSRALPVQVEWVLSCVCQYELVSFRDYVENLDSDILSEFNFPPELIADEEDSSSLGDAND